MSFLALASVAAVAAVAAVSGRGGRNALVPHPSGLPARVRSSFVVEVARFHKRCSQEKETDSGDLLSMLHWTLNICGISDPSWGAGSDLASDVRLFLGENNEDDDEEVDVEHGWELLELARRLFQG